MAAPTHLATPQLRQRLLSIILDSGQFDTQQKRGILLLDLPPALVNNLSQATDTKTDLLQIIHAAAAFEGAAENDPPPLLQMVENAINYIGEGSAATEQLKVIRAELLARQIRARTILRSGIVSPPAVRAVALTADGRQAVSWAANGVLSLWKNLTAAQSEPTTLSTGKEVQDVTALTVVQIEGKAQAFTISSGNQLIGWDLQDHQPQAPMTLPVNCATALAFHPDGEQIVVGLPSGALALLKRDPGSHEFLPPTFLGDSPWVPRHSSPIAAVWVTTAGLGISATRNSARWWGLSTGNELVHFILPQPGEQLVAVALLPDGKHILYSTGANEVKIRTLNTDPLQDPTILKLLADDLPTLSPALAVAADGQTAVAGRNDGSLCVWDLRASPPKAN